MIFRRWSALVLACGLAAAAWVGASAQDPTPAPKKSPYLKMAEPWPSAEEMTARRVDAESRALFTSHDPIAITFLADFKTVNKDHDPKSRKRYTGEVRFAREEGRIDTLPVQLSARGHVRRMARTCDYVPLRVEFPKDKVAGTVFAHQTALKLVVQCAGGGEYEQYLLREYLAYRIYNLVTPRSFRARLAKVTYVDPASNKTLGSRFGMFLEDDGDVAKRLEGRAVDLPRVEFKDVDMDSMMPMMIFNYMIGNTDFSIYALHNVVIVVKPDKSLHSIPYDFDISGLVHPPYAIPDRQLMIKSVQDRLYRGPCRRQEQIDPIIANFVAKKDQILALPASIPEMDRASRDDAKSYLESFYSSIKSDKDVRRLFVADGGGCKNKSTM